MAVYIVTGKLGSGKTLACVGRIRDALLQGRKVATNLDLNLEKLLPSRAGRKHPVTCYRLPDKPSVPDLEAIGLGCEDIDESRYGLIVLDELGTWLNTRTWADKTRQSVIDWLLHSRKKGWDVYFIIQNVGMIDKQVRDGIAEYHAACKRLDRIRIPFVGGLLQAMGFKGLLPKLHISTVRYGMDRDALVADRWTYRGKGLYDAYDTRQVFTDRDMSVFSYLSPWHLQGRYEQPRGFFHRFFSPAPRRAILSNKHPLVAQLMCLPKDERIVAFRDLQRVGMI